MALNYEHLIALGFLGLGGLALILTNHVEAGSTLLGALAGYAFKNGIRKA